MAFGLTGWGLTAATWGFGLGGYYNPYYDTPVVVNNQPVVSYSEPVMSEPAQMAMAADENSPTDADPATDVFNQARSAFYTRDFDQALSLTDQALQISPRDAAINEFRSLCLFALGRYREAAGTIHAVLAVGPGWDWTTLASLYDDTSVYSDQLRRLENSIKEQDSAEGRFLLAYHYITCGHIDSAVTQLRSVIKLQPKDKVAQQLLTMYAPDEAEAGDPPEPNITNETPPAYPLEKLKGQWTAAAEGGEFKLALEDEDKFSWSFVRNGQPQSVDGTFVLKGQNLAMEPTTGGVMLSEITLKDDGTLEFAPVGQSTKLTFKR